MNFIERVCNCFITLNHFDPHFIHDQFCLKTLTTYETGGIPMTSHVLCLFPSIYFSCI